jgi:large subunit ribosomal protein L10
MAKIVKELMVNELVNRYKSEQTIFLIDYRGLGTIQTLELRKDIREAKGQINITKNSILKRAFEKLGMKELTEHFTGMRAVIYGTDPAKLAKNVISFRNKNKVLEIKCGFVNGVFLTPEKIEELSKLPPREELLRMIVCNLASPMINFACVLNGVMLKFARVITLIKEQKNS